MKAIINTIKNTIHNMYNEYKQAMSDTNNNIMWMTDTQGHVIPVPLY